MIEARHGFTSHCPRSSYAPSFLLAWKMEIQSITALCQHMLVRLGVVPVTNATLAPYNQLTAPHQRVQASLGVVPVTNTTLAPSNPITVGALQCTHRPVGKRKITEIFLRLV
jgi:hypothetical protein